MLHKDNEKTKLYVLANQLAAYFELTVHSLQGTLLHWCIQDKKLLALAGIEG